MASQSWTEDWSIEHAENCHTVANSREGENLPLTELARIGRHEASTDRLSRKTCVSDGHFLLEAFRLDELRICFKLRWYPPSPARSRNGLPLQHSIECIRSPERSVLYMYNMALVAVTPFSSNDNTGVLPFEN